MTLPSHLNTIWPHLLLRHNLSITLRLQLPTFYESSKHLDLPLKYLKSLIKVGWIRRAWI